MTKSELIAQIAENAGISKSDADKAYGATVSAIISGLKGDGNVLFFFLILVFELTDRTGSGIRLLGVCPLYLR